MQLQMQMHALSQNGGDKKVDDTIQKNRNLSELLSQDTVGHQRAVNPMPGFRGPAYNAARYTNARYPAPPNVNQIRTFNMASANRGMIMPDGSPAGMPYQTGMPGGVLPPMGPHPNMVGYPPRQQIEFARMGLDDMNRQFPANMAAARQYFSNGPDMRDGNIAAMMNGVAFQRPPGTLPGRPSSAAAAASLTPGAMPFPVDFPPQGPHQMFQGPVGGSAMFSGMMNPADITRPFSPVSSTIPMQNIGGNFVSNSYPMNNMGPAMAMVNRGVVPQCSIQQSAMSAGNGSNMQQLVNGSHMLSSMGPNVGTAMSIPKPMPLDVDPAAASKNVIVANALTNCSRLQSTMPGDINNSAASKSTMAGVRLPIPAPVKDGGLASLDANLVCNY